MRHSRTAWAVGIAFMALVFSVPLGGVANANTGSAPPLELSGPDGTSQEGHFFVRWESDSPIQLQMAQDDGAYVDLYQGPDQQIYMSGLLDGEYSFRVRAQTGGDWSAVLRVPVQHHSISTALGFFAVGAFVFLATVFVTIRGRAS